MVKNRGLFGGFWAQNLYSEQLSEQLTELFLVSLSPFLSIPPSPPLIQGGAKGSTDEVFASPQGEGEGGLYVWGMKNGERDYELQGEGEGEGGSESEGSMWEEAVFLERAPRVFISSIRESKFPRPVFNFL